MGKVYEALNRAEEQFDQSDAALLGLDGAGKPRTKERFDFMEYSLSAPTASERERARMEATAVSRARERLAQPGREVAIEADRVEPHLVLFNDFDPVASEQYNKVAVALISRASDLPSKRVLITSAGHGEGRTSAALNLAAALARARQRVLVIDCDTLRPSVLRLLGIEAEVGLGELVARDLPSGEATVRVLPHGFNVLPTRGPIENSAELLASPAFRRVLEEVEPDYDFILFDSSPLLASGDLGLLARLTDTTLMIIRAGRTNPTQMARAIAPLNQQSLCGVVLNHA